MKTRSRKRARASNIVDIDAARTKSATTIAQNRMSIEHPLAINIFIQDDNDNITIAWFRNILPPHMVTALGELIMANVPCAASVDDLRETQNTTKFGYMAPQSGRYWWLVKETKSSMTVFGRKVQLDFKQLWDIISNVVFKYFPTFAHILSKIPQEFRPFGLFSALFVNFEDGGELYLDSTDFGYGRAFTFGSFEGGALDFPYLNWRCTLQVRDLIIFRNSAVTYNNAPFQGSRGSCVLGTHQHTFAQTTK